MINTICNYCAADEYGDVIDTAEDIINFYFITDHKERISIEIGNNADSIGLVVYKETPYKLANGKKVFSSDPIKCITLPFKFCPMCGRRF